MRRRWIFAFVAIGASAVVGLNAVGCGDGRPPASDGPGTSGNYRTGPCSTNGETVACDVETGRVGNVVNCFNGTQTCQNGVWGACGAGGTSGTLSTVILPTDIDIDNGALSTQAVSMSDASATAAGCANNPCDPFCLGIDADAGNGIQTDGGVVTTIGALGTTSPFSTFPTAKCGAMAGGTNCIIGNGCQVFTPAPNDNECNYDYCCAHAADASVGSIGKCVQWVDPADAAGACTAASNGNQIDYTMGVGCADSTGGEHLPVCNRGTANAIAGKLLLYGYSSNPNNISTNASNNTCALPSSGSYSASCVIDLSVNHLNAGKCLDVSLASPAPGIVCDGTSLGSGDRSAMINPPNVTIPNGASRTAYGSSGYTQLPEADKCNNYSFVKNTIGDCVSYGSVSTPPPATYAFTYRATCPSGTGPQWNQFAYNTSAPTQSDDLFAATTQIILPDGGLGTPTSSITLADPGAVGSTDPQVCPMSGPSPCPVNLATKLGANSIDPVLNLTITVTDTTSVTPPTVYSWSITYNCLPNQ